MRKYIVLLVLVILLFIVSYEPYYPSIETLLLSVDDFPSGWSADEEGPKPSPVAPFGRIKSVERTTLDFQSTTTVAYQEIERFGNSKDVNREFLNQRELLFRERQYEGSFSIPDELPYQSSITEQYNFSCTRPSNYPYPYLRCIYLARYGPYVVKFRIDWNLDEMNADEVEVILRAIDEKMAPYVN